MIADCHMHTEFSADSETKITDQVERAIQLGLFPTFVLPITWIWIIQGEIFN